MPILIILAVQAFLGLIAIEYAFSRLKRMQNDHDEKRDQYYHAFRRTDSKRWSRCKFYPGALFSIPVRIVILILQGILLLLMTKIVTIGHDFSKGPIKEGCRKSIIAVLYKVNAFVFVFVAGIFTSSSK